MTRELRDPARILLGVIRSINGLLALFTPKFLLRKLRVDPDQNGPAIYALRMFGVRTVFLGAELFTKEGEDREKALRTGVLIHASDTLSALICWKRGYLPKRSGAVATLISLVNTLLAIAAMDRSRSGEPARDETAAVAG